VEFKVGTGGWQYFPILKVDRLRGYSKLFDFVEVNSTFYDQVPLRTVARWREVVPPEFEFSVKCSRGMADALQRGDRPRLSQLLDYLERVCEVLGSKVLVLQTPARLDVEGASEEALLEIMDSTRSRALRLAWEARSGLSPRTLSVLRAKGIVHVTDLSRSSPLLHNEILYTRLFGLGEHNLYRFTPQDFKVIEDRALSSGAKEAYFTFHGVAMYADALRFKRDIGLRQDSA
jgi:uncharacterized protein YecE (DUF72 family)